MTPEPAPKKKRRKWPIIAGVVVVVIVIAAVSNKSTPVPTPTASPATTTAAAAPTSAATSAPKSEVPTTSPAATSQSVEPTTASAVSPPKTPAATTTAKAATTTAKAPITKAPVAPAVSAAKTYSGTGDDIVKVDLGGKPGIVQFTCKGCSGNTTLTSNSADGLLVNAIGAYQGEHVIDTADGSVTTKLTVTADAAWTATISSIASLKPLTTHATGHGDTVIALTGTGTQATITNVKGTDNFVVTGYGASFPELAVNEIGSYKGTVSLTTPAVVQVQSDGDWTITTAP